MSQLTLKEQAIADAQQSITDDAFSDYNEVLSIVQSLNDDLSGCPTQFDANAVVNYLNDADLINAFSDANEFEYL